MTDYKRTPLRHQALHLIANDQVSRGLGPSGWSYSGLCANAPLGHLNRAVDAAIHAGHARSVGEWRDPIALTGVGNALLSAWNAKHGTTATR
jgi:hypothetical protein